MANFGAHPAYMSGESPKFGLDRSSNCVLPTMALVCATASSERAWRGRPISLEGRDGAAGDPVRLLTTGRSSTDAARSRISHSWHEYVTGVTASPKTRTARPAVRRERPLRSAPRPLGHLPGGIPYFAPIGEMVYEADEDRVQCHLCGEWLRVVAGSHLTRAHGWSVGDYRETFRLLTTQATCARGFSDKQREHAKRRIALGEPPVGARVSREALREVYRTRRFPAWRSLGARHPELVAELHPTRNGSLDPFAVPARSHRKLWWLCESGHEWAARVYNRASGTQCPVCQRNHARGARMVHTVRERAPALLAEVHPTMNSGLEVASMAAGSHRKVWWRCEKGHAWRAEVQSRVRGSGCPRCRRSGA